MIRCGPVFDHAVLKTRGQHPRQGQPAERVRGHRLVHDDVHAPAVLRTAAEQAPQLLLVGRQRVDLPEAQARNRDMVPAGVRVLGPEHGRGGGPPEIPAPLGLGDQDPLLALGRVRSGGGGARGGFRDVRERQPRPHGHRPLDPPPCLEDPVARIMDRLVVLGRAGVPVLVLVRFQVVVDDLAVLESLQLPPHDIRGVVVPDMAAASEPDRVRDQGRSCGGVRHRPICVRGRC